MDCIPLFHIGIAFLGIKIIASKFAAVEIDDKVVSRFRQPDLLTDPEFRNPIRPNRELSFAQIHFFVLGFSASFNFPIV